MGLSRENITFAKREFATYNTITGRFYRTNTERKGRERERLFAKRPGETEV